jgi:predicted transcriptional regulator
VASTKTPFSASEEAVNRIEVIAEHMLSPELVLCRFERPVDTIAPEDTVFAVLMLIRERDYSQFPVYCGTAFHGLLTENGITRWLARHVTANGISLADIRVEKLLMMEEGLTNHEFLSSDSSVDQVVHLYATNPDLEAVLITNDGKQTSDLKGIATPYDVVQLRAMQSGEPVSLA